MKNIYNGFILPGETGFTGSHWLPGYLRRSHKYLFSAFGKEWGLVNVSRRTDWEFKVEALNLLSRYYKIVVNSYDSCGELIDSLSWAGRYPKKQPGLTYLVRCANNYDDIVGTPAEAMRLFRRGIIAEVIDSSHNVCSIGYCAREEKWYGWSHRAIFGFGIGDVVKEGDCVTTSGWTEEYLSENPDKDLRIPVGFQAKSMADCKRLAIAFADSVS
jgi:hypothetical protein